MKNLVLTLIVGTCLGALGMSGTVQPQATRVLGAFLSHETEETYYISVGATPAGNEPRDGLESEFRNAVVVPDHYGDVVAVTAAQDAAVVWYRDAVGVVRNVILYDSNALLYSLEQRTTNRREVRLNK